MIQKISEQKKKRYLILIAFLLALIPRMVFLFDTYPMSIAGGDVQILWIRFCIPAHAVVSTDRGPCDPVPDHCVSDDPMSGGGSADQLSYYEKILRYGR